MADVEGIRARTAAASTPPWRRHGADVWSDESSVPLFTGQDGSANARAQADADAEFVAPAREDVVALLEALDSARTGDPEHAHEPDDDQDPSAGKHATPTVERPGDR